MAQTTTVVSLDKETQAEREAWLSALILPCVEFAPLQSV